MPWTSTWFERCVAEDLLVIQLPIPTLPPPICHTTFTIYATLTCSCSYVLYWPACCFTDTNIRCDLSFGRWHTTKRDLSYTRSTVCEGNTCIFPLPPCTDSTCRLVYRCNSTELLKAYIQVYHIQLYDHVYIIIVPLWIDEQSLFWTQRDRWE